MEIQALGYVGIGASDLTDWTRFASDWLGMQMIERVCHLVSWSTRLAKRGSV